MQNTRTRMTLMTGTTDERTTIKSRIYVESLTFDNVSQYKNIDYERWPAGVESAYTRATP